MTARADIGRLSKQAAAGTETSLGAATRHHLPSVHPCAVDEAEGSCIPDRTKIGTEPPRPPQMVNIQFRFRGQGVWFVSAPLTVQAAQTVATAIRDRIQPDELQINPSAAPQRVDIRT
jgi:hypothetical protein